MKRLWKLFSHPEFHVLLFAIGLVVLNWPFLGTLRERSPQVILGTIVVLWSIAIVLLFVISRSCRSSLANGTMNERKGRNA